MPDLAELFRLFPFAEYGHVSILVSSRYFLVTSNQPECLHFGLAAELWMLLEYVTSRVQPGLICDHCTGIVVKYDSLCELDRYLNDRCTLKR